MNDWYETGLMMFLNELANEVGLTKEQAKLSYSFLVDAGLIDYDSEKEFIWDRYFCEEE